jgi:hypothetical protein
MTNGTVVQRKTCLSANFTAGKTSLRNIAAAFGLLAERLEEVV